MAKKQQEFEDAMTFDYDNSDNDFPTQEGTVVNNSHEEKQKPLAVSDVADKIANRKVNQEPKDNSQTKMIIWGIFGGICFFALIVVADVFMSM